MEQANEKKMDAVNALGEGVFILERNSKMQTYSFFIDEVIRKMVKSHF